MTIVGGLTVIIVTIPIIISTIILILTKAEGGAVEASSTPTAGILVSTARTLISHRSLDAEVGSSRLSPAVQARMEELLTHAVTQAHAPPQVKGLVVVVLMMIWG
jgi:hypothetical protein